MKFVHRLANILHKQCTLLMAYFKGRGCPKLQIQNLSKTLKSQKFKSGISDKSVFLVDWQGIRLNVCKRTWILTHANHPATSTALDVLIFDFDVIAGVVISGVKCMARDRKSEGTRENMSDVAECRYSRSRYYRSAL